ncbi:putative membrane spanning protein [Borrelia duttonii CR2A]|uniref:Putative membrane spanning protein n=1 Tax=Borrelia duttonii CR2A TaxID=1432657 RepID=W6TG50_9SPIR|nr:virulence associated lipoprotein [Borrelia duttonii]ETZ17877.1 putative membrane spanning protein [Borrelia duttonii CR2A]
MKRKDFILFIMFVFILILLLLVSCGPKKYTPVSSAVRRNGVDGPQGGAGDNEQILKQKEIESIKIPDKVSQILKTHDDANWDEDAAGYNLTGANQLFAKVTYTIFIKGKFLYWLYNDETDEIRAKESKESRREFYLACEYNANFIKAFAGVVNKLVATDELLEKNKGEIVFFLENVRSYARFYYDVYSILKEKQNKLDSLPLKKLQWLKAGLLKFEKEQQELHKIIQLIINDYNNDTPINSSEPTHHLKSSDTLPDEIMEYWIKDTHRGECHRKFSEIIKTAIMIKDLLKGL